MIKPISLRKLIQRLHEDFGFDGPYSGGKHQFMIKGELKLRVPNPHIGDISTGLISNILKQAGIKNSEWGNK